MVSRSSTAMRMVSLALLAGLVARDGAAQTETEPRPSLEHYGSAYQTHVAIDVDGLGDKGIVELGDGMLHASVINRRDTEVETRLSIDVQAHGALRSFDQGAQALAAGATRRVDLALGALGITVGALETPAIVTFRVTTKDDAGDDVDGLVSPAYYLHEHARRGVILYSERRLQRMARGGDLTGLFRDSRGKDRFRKHIKIFAGPAEGTPDPWAPLPIGIPDERTICIHWNYQSGDHNAGERYYAAGEPMAARGVKLTIFQDNVGPTGQTVYADKDTGCVSVELEAVPALVTISAEARIGTNAGIRVRAYETSATPTPGDDKLKKWAFYFLPGPAPVHLYVPAGISSTLMAFGSFSAHSLDGLHPLIEPGADAQPGAVLDLRYRKNATNSYAGIDEARIAKTQFDRKFVYGHEIGHWYVSNQGASFSGSYEHDGSSPACWSKKEPPEVNHLLRSAETTTAAFNEGLVHFLSTLVWNGLGRLQPRFRYYKDMAPYSDAVGQYGDLFRNWNLVDMAAATDSPFTLGGVRNWRDEMCTSDDTSKYSVELDWARFLMNYLDGQTWSTIPGPAPTFGDLVEQLLLAHDLIYTSGPGTDYKTYMLMRNALDVPDLDDFIERWEFLAPLYGVDFE